MFLCFYTWDIITADCADVTDRQMDVFNMCFCGERNSYG